MGGGSRDDPGHTLHRRQRGNGMTLNRLGERVSPPRLTRRASLRAGSIGLLGLGISDLFALRAGASAGQDGVSAPVASKKSVIFIFLTGGLSHQDSFDLKPEASETVRGEFRPIATRAPGIEICEHLPLF